MVMISKKDLRAAGRAFARTYPAIDKALKVEECIYASIGYVFQLITNILRIITVRTFNFFKYLPARTLNYLSCNSKLELPGESGHRYKRLDKVRFRHEEPVPYENDTIRRTLTYYGGLSLGFCLYLFIYFVLIKHHSFPVVSISFILMIAYLLVLENSHTIRSILMLCLPIMFTNRGRALIFCTMLAIMASGPVRNAQSNISSLSASVNCCKQYLIIKSDEYMDENMVKDVVKVEKVIISMVENVKKFATEIRDKMRLIIQLAITVEQYLEIAIKQLMEIIKICNDHALDSYEACRNLFDAAYLDCNHKLGVTFSALCEIVQPVKQICTTVQIPHIACHIPSAIAHFVNDTVGEELRQMMIVIENEFYVDVDIEHDFVLNSTQSKSYKQVLSQIKGDAERKFWYISLANKVFNLVSLVLVCWILCTATFYHMHYLTDLSYDNRYLDKYLVELDEKRKQSPKKINDEPTERKSLGLRAINFEDDTLLVDQSPYSPDSVRKDSQKYLDGSSFLFPIPEEQQRLLTKPFSFKMNDSEKSKLMFSGLIWAVIVGYIFFFVILDYSLYKLMDLVNEIMNDILFSGDLPLVDINVKTGQDAIQVDRTHLSDLRSRILANRINEKHEYSGKVGTFSNLYRRLMDSLEENIPDEIAILDSLKECLPKTSEPNYINYERLAYLTAITLVAVFLEAYAMRLRHCLANLYYPKRAKNRAVWLYRKLLIEKPSFLESKINEKSPEMNLALKLITKEIHNEDKRKGKLHNERVKA